MSDSRSATVSVWKHPPSAVTIARHIAAGELSAVEVLEPHLARIEDVDRKLNAVVVRRFEAARAEARVIDECRRRGQPLGPLAGVPITVKECFQLAGTPATLGVRRRAEPTARTDGPLVARLRAAGAIVVGKTNVPQLMLLYETDNPLYGRTNNPWDLDRAVGGSSGGEAAIIAAGGVPLGLASDLGGSIRQPAHVCGIHGLKPTGGRLTRVGMGRTFEGFDAFPVQPGPMARHVEDLALAMRVLLAAEIGGIAGQDDGDDSNGQRAKLEPMDTDVAPVVWSDPANVSVGALRVAYWTEDGYFPASPAIRRAVVEAAGALRSHGAVVEPLDPPDVGEAMRLYFGLAGADGGRGFRELLGSSCVDWRVRKLVRWARFPRWMRPLACAMLRAFGEHRTARLVSQAGGLPTGAYWRMVAARQRYARQFLNRLRLGGYDAILTPPYALPAVPHGFALTVLPAGSYSLLPNLLDMPAGVVAATRVRQYEESDRPASRDRCDRAAMRAEQGSVGLPVGVQVIGLPWREDIVLALMSALESHFRMQPDYPAQPPV
jgi:fatty acid amide hydrolase